MSKGERLLTVLLGGGLVLAVVAGLGYFVFVAPIVAKNRQAAALDTEIADKERELAAARKNMPRLATALKRSLPDGANTSQEYEAVLAKMLHDAKVPGGAAEIKFRAADSRPVPEIGPKKPAYSRIVIEITLKKVTYATVLSVLDRYYAMNLLQQITKFNLKRADDPGARPVSSTSSDRPDLTLTFLTEGIVLDGAEKRRSILPVPVAMGAAGGAAGLHALMNTPEPARGIKPVELANVLATADRDYTLLLMKDIFHGPPPPIVIPSLPPVPPVVVKEDTSPFIRLTALGKSSDGSGMAVIEDLACPTKMEYTVSIRRTSDGLIADVAKEYFSKGKRKPFAPNSAVLDISESSSGTDRKFRVIGVDGTTLLLAEKPKLGAAVEPKAGFGGGFGGGFGKKPTAPKPPASSAVLGGLAYGVQSAPEKVFAWTEGEPLSKIKELSKGDAEKAVLRATVLPALTSVPPSGPPTTPNAVEGASAGK